MKGKCLGCKKVKELQKHHASYEPEIIIDICKECHIKIHRHGVGSPIRIKRDLKEEILNYLNKHKSEFVCITDVSKGLNVSYATTNRHINNLEEMKKIETVLWGGMRLINLNIKSQREFMDRLKYGAVLLEKRRRRK